MMKDSGVANTLFTGDMVNLRLKSGQNSEGILAIPHGLLHSTIPDSRKYFFLLSKKAQEIREWDSNKLGALKENFPLHAENLMFGGLTNFHCYSVDEVADFESLDKDYNLTLREEARIVLYKNSVSFIRRTVPWEKLLYKRTTLRPSTSMSIDGYDDGIVGSDLNSNKLAVFSRQFARVGMSLAAGEERITVPWPLGAIIPNLRDGRRLALKPLSISRFPTAPLYSYLANLDRERRVSFLPREVQQDSPLNPIAAVQTSLRRSDPRYIVCLNQKPRGKHKVVHLIDCSMLRVLGGRASDQVFWNGDRVRVVESYTHRKRNLLGELGRVVVETDREGDVGIQFDRLSHLSSLEGKSPTNSCLYVPSKILRKE